MSSKQLEWIKTGYGLVAQHGFNNLNIESIAREMKKNKSSFYHYFGELDIFTSELLSYHVERSEDFSRRVGECESIQPSLIHVFLDYKHDLFFHKQLRIHRSNKEFQLCFERAFANYEAAFMDNWVDFLGLQKQPHLAKTFLNLMVENFMLKITQDSYSYDWINTYLEEASAMIKQLNTDPG